MKKLLLSLLLVAGLLGYVEEDSFAAVAFVATSTGPNTSATSETLTLPTGYNTAGNVTVAVFTQTCTVSSTIGTMTAPAGWTTLLNTPCTLVVYRAFQGGDGSSITASSSSSSNWWISVANTYSGCDTTTPVDNFSSFVTIRSDNTSLFRAPSLNPNFNNSMLMVGFTSNQSSGSPAWSGKPAGFTQRGNSDAGPHIWTGEKALTNGTGTGDQAITGETGINFHVGFQIALKQSGAAAATLDPPFPYIAGVSGTLIGAVGASFTPHLDYVGVQNNDIVLVSILGAGVFTTPTGYTKENATLGAVVYSHLWLTGDTLTPTFTYSSGSTYTPYSVHIIRPMSAANVYKDQISGALTSGTTAVTGTTNSLTPLGSNELLLAIFGRNTSAGTDVWSAVSGGLTTDINSSSLLNVAGHVAGATSPTGTFSATDTVTGQTFGIEAVAALYTVTNPATASVAPHKLLIN